MVELTKKQVKAIIKFLSSDYLSGRPDLQVIHFRNGLGYICDGFAAIYFPSPFSKDYEGEITVDQLKEFASVKSFKKLGDEDFKIMAIARKGNYPEIEELIPKKFTDLTEIIINPRLLASISDIMDTNDARMKFSGKYTPIKIEPRDSAFKAILMPMHE